jgi:hypothetical protein
MLEIAFRVEVLERKRFELKELQQVAQHLHRTDMIATG